LPRPSASFYFDLSSAPAYLAAERILNVLPAPAEWLGVLARELPGAALAAERRSGAQEERFRAEIAGRARELALQPLRWPEPFPFDSTMAMRVATYARSIGRTVPFAQAAFRQAFAGGHSLQEPDHVLIAAAACEMHPAAVLRGAKLRSVERELSAVTARAARLGVLDVPALHVADTRAGGPGRVFLGEGAVEEAAGYMSASATAGPPR
jgi:2-hydroxychromene-2-carboxylate isomerase